MKMMKKPWKRPRKLHQNGLKDLCLIVYTAELLAHFLLKGFSILKDWMICMDLAIIVCHSALGFTSMLHLPPSERD